MKTLSIVLLKLLLTLGPGFFQTAAAAPLTLPAGTPLELQVSRPVYADATHVSLQVAAPVVQGQRIAIPAGTEVLGIVETTRWSGRNGERDRARLRLDRMILPNHQIINISGVVDELPRVPSLRARMSAEEVAVPIFVGGALLSVLTNRIAPLLIGAAGGTVGGIAVARSNRDGPVWLRAGQHFEMLFELPLTLDSHNLQ